MRQVVLLKKDGGFQGQIHELIQRRRQGWVRKGRMGKQPQGRLSDKSQGINPLILINNSIQMSYFLTPVKEAVKKPTKSNSHNKPQDWVCVLCNNLNFSFRKKCNRCKTQTRTQNENHIASAYSHYYCEHKHPSSLVKSPLSDATNFHTPQRSLLDPNLSKLAKQYCPKEPQTTIDFAASNAKKEMFDIDFWESINVRDFQEVCWEKQGSKEGNWEREWEGGDVACQFGENELEGLISKILLEEN